MIVVNRKAVMYFLGIQTLFVFLQVYYFFPCIFGSLSIDSHIQHSKSSGKFRESDKVRREIVDNSVEPLKPQLETSNFHAPDLSKPVEHPDVLELNAEKSKIKHSILLDHSKRYSDKKYSATWESLETGVLPSWYDEAKIGIFLHWGPYSVPSYTKAGTHGYSEWFWFWWKGDKGLTQEEPWYTATRSVREYMSNHYPPSFKYSDFVSQFTAEFFDANAWADLFELSGAKYVVLTSKHHDGYTLWPSTKSHHWNSVETGPGRDIIDELASAVRSRTHLRFGLYHSLFEWFNPLYRHDNSTGHVDTTYVQEKLIPELVDLVERYKPEVVWADGDWEANCSYWSCKEFFTYLYNYSPVRETVVVNDRWGSDVRCRHGDFLTCSDYFNPALSAQKMTRKWENCMTLDRESWGYRRNARLSEYFSMEELTEVVVQTISYGGNILMNVGPTADGRIIPVFEERLLQLGQWLKVNGEAIYSTSTWNIFQDNITSNVYYTKKPDALYAITVRWPKDDRLYLSAPVPTSSTKVHWLGYPESIEWSKHPTQGLYLTLPKVSLSSIPCQWAWSFKLTLVANL